MNNQNPAPDPREHGFPNSYDICGAPEIVRPLLASACPVCGCSKTFGISLQTHTEGVGNCTSLYRGCAACEWASAMSSVPNAAAPLDVQSYPFERLS